MARERQRYASVRPSQAEEGGGKFTIPAGAVCTITEAQWTEWREAGAGAIKKGRRAEDPALKITVEVDGRDEPLTEFLGAGKAERLVPSKDGEHLEPADSSEAGAITKDCNADVFLASVCDVKAQKKLAFPEAELDEGISSLEGLKFVAGRRIVKRDMEDDGGGDRKAPRPSLISEENLKLPKGVEPASGNGGRSRGKDKEEEPEERPRRGRDKDDDKGKDKDDDRPARGRGKGDDADDDVAIEEEAEAAVVEVLDMSKWSKGLPEDKAFSQIYNVVKGTDNSKKVMELVEDPKWMANRKRPWEVADGLIQKP